MPTLVLEIYKTALKKFFYENMNFASVHFLLRRQPLQTYNAYIQKMPTVVPPYDITRETAEIVGISLCADKTARHAKEDTK
jgi:hypothetical protein